MAVLLPAPEDPATHAPGAPPRTPYLVLDVALALRRYADLAAALPGTRIHYAVKANPEPTLLARLVAAGSAFDVASPAEVAACLAAGADTADLVYSNPVTSRHDLVEAGALGVRLFVADGEGQLTRLAAAVPGAQVLIRIATSGHGSDWSLSRKYGCDPADAVSLLASARRLGLGAAGVSFHVGSQQRDPAAWDAPIAQAARIFAAARQRGLDPWLLDLGGGFPADLDGGPDQVTPRPAAYGAAIEAALGSHFPGRRPATLVEPGRGVVGDAGTLVASVIGLARRGGRRWVFLDAGVFTGLVETLDEAIRYRLETDRGGPLVPCVLAGPTCDSADVLYERTPAMLPRDLREGDQVRLRAAGAYTTCYSTVGFNGFPPLATRLAPQPGRAR
ncbi:type III PLP-dependent enzyme [Nocardioides sp.]|uniref:type III PLP-dependent enzyme n=1 Tax=Nocardioides sp. TaxID=35761 RepID=UPI003527B76C